MGTVRGAIPPSTSSPLHNEGGPPMSCGQSDASFCQPFFLELMGLEGIANVEPR